MNDLAALCGPGDRALVVIAHPDDETFCAGLAVTAVSDTTSTPTFQITRAGV